MSTRDRVGAWRSRTAAKPNLPRPVAGCGLGEGPRSPPISLRWMAQQRARRPRSDGDRLARFDQRFSCVQGADIASCAQDRSDGIGEHSSGEHDGSRNCDDG